MPTRYRRIPVINDPSLADAVARVERYFPGAPAARIVHDLAIKGAETVVSEAHGRQEAIERLVDISTNRRDLIDWAVLETVDELAWDS